MAMDQSILLTTVASRIDLEDLKVHVRSDVPWHAYACWPCQQSGILVSCLSCLPLAPSCHSTTAALSSMNGILSFLFVVLVTEQLAVASAFPTQGMIPTLLITCDDSVVI